MPKLVILPGLSSPAVSEYQAVYKLLVEHAPSYGYDQTQIIFYPGQLEDNRPIRGCLSPDSAIAKVKGVIAKLEKSEKKYRLLGISFGCIVALSAVLKTNNELNFLDKIVLWGPIPYWRSWKAFGSGARDQALGKGAKFIKNPKMFHAQTEPIEVLLPTVNYKVHICIGTNDKYVPVEYGLYLASLSRGNGHLTFSIVQGCSHNVKMSDDENWLAYLDTIFA